MANNTQKFIAGAHWHATQLEKMQPKVREWVEFTRLIATPDNWKRIQEYNAIPSRCDE